MLSGREEGWYELRTVEDEVVCGASGVAEALIRLAVEDKPLAEPAVAHPPAAPAPRIEDGGQVLARDQRTDVELIDVTVVKARHLPGGAGSGGVPDAHAVVQVGGSTRRTKTVKGTRTPEWHAGFSLPIVARGPAGDLASVVVWDEGVGDGQKGLVGGGGHGRYVGHIAVPIGRIKEGGGEEGWYDMRDQEGDVVAGGPQGAPTAALLVKFRHRVMAGGLKAAKGWLAKPAARGGSERVWCVLDPYTRIMGEFAGEGEREAEAARHVAECELRRVGEGGFGGGAFGFEATIAGTGEVVRYAAATRPEWEMWFGAFRDAGCRTDDRAASQAPRMPPSSSAAGGGGGGWGGGGPPMRSPSPQSLLTGGDAARHPAAPPPPRGQAPLVEAPAPEGLLEAYVMRARHLPAAASASGTPCATLAEVKVGGRAMTCSSGDAGAAVSWNESFQFPVEASRDALATVVLWALDRSGSRVMIGHIAVPVARIAASSREEGWYDVRSADGVPLTTATGPSAVLVNFIFAPAVQQRVPRGWATVIGHAPGAPLPPQELFCALDPYAQELLCYASPPGTLAADTALRRFPIRCLNTKP